jgi:enoyl-CoA hydratase/carnithine racemase
MGACECNIESARAVFFLFFFEVRELCFTGRTFDAAAAARLGLVSRVVDGSGPHVQAAAVALAVAIAALSPVAVAGTKAALLAARDHGVAAGLDQVHRFSGPQSAASRGRRQGVPST